MTFRRPSRSSYLRTSNDAMKHPCRPLVPFASFSEYARLDALQKPLALMTSAARSDPGQANPARAVTVRRAPRATVRMNSEMSRLRSHTKTARSRVLLHQDGSVHARRSSGSGHRALSPRRCRREDAPGPPRPDPRRPPPSTLSVGCITAPPEQAPALRRPSMTARESDRSHLHTTASPI